MAGRVGRNDPCPCGSGKKYKRCCLARDEAPVTQAVARDPGPLLDDKLVPRMMRYASERLGAAFDAWRAFERECHGDTGDGPLFIPWALFHYPVQGRPVIEWYLADNGPRLSERERAWLQSQRKARYSIWEVTGVEPGTSLSLRCLLTGAEHTVKERTASRILSRWHVVLGRVVQYDGNAYVVGCHMRPLPPSDGKAAADLVRRDLKVRSRLVPEERLRTPEASAGMIRAWEEVLREFDTPQSVPPLTNTDGHELAYVTDRHSFDPDKRAQVKAGLCALKGAEVDSEKDGELRITFTRLGNRMNKAQTNAIVGTAILGRDTLSLETNSSVRAAALLRRARKACPDLLLPLSREQKSAEYLLRERLKGSRPDAQETRPPVSPEERRLLREYLDRENVAWLDAEVPILGGLTPRDASRSRRWRPVLEVLLKELDLREGRKPPEARQDTKLLRRELGLERNED